MAEIALKQGKFARIKSTFISGLSNFFTRRKKELPDPNASVKRELAKAEKKYHMSFAALDKYHYGVVMLGSDNEAALKAFDEAIALKGDCWYFYKERARAHRNLGKTELALADLKRAKSYRPKNNL